jgi:hypothetical protein
MAHLCTCDRNSIFLNPDVFIIWVFTEKACFLVTSILDVGNASDQDIQGLHFYEAKMHWS